MNKRIYKKEQYNTSRWSGGSTVETAIFPQKSKYLERDFIWRLSSATVEAEESSFTKLPDYDRVLMVLDGSVILAYGDERSAALEQWQKDNFSGAVKTKCFGKMTDYNLMFKKGCKGSLQLIDANKDAIEIKKSIRGELPEASYGFYCAEGYVIISVDGETSLVKQGQQMVIDFDVDEDKPISVMGEGKCIMAEVIYKRQRYIADEIPEAKATFEDFKTAFKLAHSRNRWSQALNSNKKSELWYDEALEKKLSFLDKSYITFIIWLIVLLLLTLPMFLGISMKIMFIMMVTWSVIHLIVIAPLIYVSVLPKPIEAHIKKASELTEYERGLYEIKHGSNEKVEKLLKKYRAVDDENYESYRDKLKNIFR